MPKVKPGAWAMQLAEKVCQHFVPLAGRIELNPKPVATIIEQELEALTLENRALAVTAAVLCAKYKQAEAAIAELREVLASVEWITDSEYPGRYCPECSEREDNGHLSHCRLGTVVARTARKQEKS